MATTKKNAKATKKFEKKHLKGVLERRKVTAKTKQRKQITAKKQERRARDEEFYKGGKDGTDAAAGKAVRNKNVGKNASTMSVDAFFQGGFEILDKAEPDKKGAGKLGKRKRDGSKPRDGALEDSGDSESSEASNPLPSDGDGDDDEDGDGEANVEEDGDVGMSKEAMDSLAKDDPEFYKFLKENDPEALDFDENADFAEIDELSDGSGGEEEQPKKKRKKKAKEASSAGTAEKNELTREMVSKWERSMSERHSLTAARQVVIAFRSAARLNDGEEEETKKSYAISSPDAFHEIVIVALRKIPEVLQHHVPVKESASGKVYVPTDSKKFRTLSMLMKSFTNSILHLLRTLSDEGTLKLTLSALNPLLPYLLSFRKLLKTLIKTVVAFWSQPASTESTRITAYLILRRLMVIGDKGIRETLLKAVYQSLVQGSRVTNANTIQGINLMKNSAAELWGIDQSIGYTTAFTFIRQLAIHLRNSIVRNQNESYKTVYNWQYVHSLDFWSCVLAEHCSTLKEAEAGKESQLRLLIYPLVQVTLGAMRLIPTSAYFPLRFQLMRSLLRISRATGTYIPLASALLEVLNSAEMKKPPKSSTLKQLDFAVAYRAPKSYLRTRVYQDGVGEQVVELFSEYFALWATSIAFPELALPVIIMLKRWLKETRKRGGGNKNGKLGSSLVLLVQKLEANGRFIQDKRAAVDFAPRDRAQVDAFLKDFDWEKTPLGAFVVAQRTMRAERQKVMEEARREEERKRREEKEKEGEQEDDDAGLLSDSEEGENGQDDGEEDEGESEEEDEEDDDEEE